METVLEFTKLEKVELGGIKGKVLSQQVLNIFEAFQTEYKVFTEATYDCLDPSDPVSDYKKHAQFQSYSLYLSYPALENKWLKLRQMVYSGDIGPISHIKTLSAHRNLPR